MHGRSLSADHVRRRMNSKHDINSIQMRSKPQYTNAFATFRFPDEDERENNQCSPSCSRKTVRINDEPEVVSIPTRNRDVDKITCVKPKVDTHNSIPKKQCCSIPTACVAPNSFSPTVQQRNIPFPVLATEEEVLEEYSRPGPKGLLSFLRSRVKSVRSYFDDTPPNPEPPLEETHDVVWNPPNSNEDVCEVFKTKVWKKKLDGTKLSTRPDGRL